MPVAVEFEQVLQVIECGVGTVEDVRLAGRQLTGFSGSLNEEEKALKRFLYDRVYNAPELVAVREEAIRVVSNLAAAYRADPSLLPPEWRDDDNIQQVRRIGDFIAGMTDRFALRRHQELIGPVERPVRF